MNTYQRFYMIHHFKRAASGAQLVQRRKQGADTCGQSELLIAFQKCLDAFVKRCNSGFLPQTLICTECGPDLSRLLWGFFQLRQFWNNSKTMKGADKTKELELRNWRERAQHSTGYPGILSLHHSKICAFFLSVQDVSTNLISRTHVFKHFCGFEKASLSLSFLSWKEEIVIFTLQGVVKMKCDQVWETFQNLTRYPAFSSVGIWASVENWALSRAHPSGSSHSDSLGVLQLTLPLRFFYGSVNCS